MKEGRFSAQGASLYADNHNPIPDFAAKILDLLENQDQRVKMGTFGRKRVMEALSWEFSVDNLLAAYRRAVRTRGMKPHAVEPSKGHRRA